MPGKLVLPPRRAENVEMGVGLAMNNWVGSVVKVAVKFHRQKATIKLNGNPIYIYAQGSSKRICPCHHTSVVPLYEEPGGCSSIDDSEIQSQKLIV